MLPPASLEINNRGELYISVKDTIHIPGIELGFKRPVLFERHAVGGEYGAGWKKAGALL